MEEKKTIKISLGTAICMIIIFLLLIAIIFISFYYNSKSNNAYNVNSDVSEKTESIAYNVPNQTQENNVNNLTNQVSNNNKDQNVPNTTNPKTIKKLDESKDLLYSSYNKYSSEYSYSIPYINIDSADARRINNEIESYYKKLVEQELKNESEGYAINMYTIKYTSYINDTILSLVISHSNPNDCIYYKVYNLDIYNGTMVSNADILNLKNITEAKLLDKLKELYKNKFVSLYGTRENYINNMKTAPVGWTETELQEQAKLYDEQFNYTISDNNCSISTPMFLNDDGNICVVATIYSLAGASSYQHIIDTNI